MEKLKLHNLIQNLFLYCNVIYNARMDKKVHSNFNKLMKYFFKMVTQKSGKFHDFSKNPHCC